MFATNFFQSFRLPIVLITLSVLLLGFSCSALFGHSSMHMPMDGSMTNVISQTGDQQKCCTIGAAKNFEQWRNALLVVPNQMRNGLILLLALALVFFSSWPKFSRYAEDRLVLAYRLYARDNPDLALFNQLKLAFAQGILNTKIY